MGVIAQDNLTIQGCQGLISVNKLVIDAEPNKHACAEIEAIVADENLPGIGERDLVTICTKDGETLFKGHVAKYTQKHDGKLVSLKLELISGSAQADREKRTRSFQKPGMTYDEIFRAIENNYSCLSVENNSGNTSNPNRPVFQFGETDFALLRRLASELNTSLVVDSKLGNNSISIGMPSSSKQAIGSSSHFSVRLSSLFYHLGGVQKGLYPGGFVYYETESYDNLFIGDKITINGEERYVISRHAELVNEEVIFTYKAGSKSLLQQKLINNTNLSGVAFKGTVDDVSADDLTINLNIDKKYAKSGLTKLPWKPITSNMLYAMPEKGSTVVLQHNDNAGKYLLATACLRTNGGSCANTQQPAEKMFSPDTSGSLLAGKKKLSFTIGDTTLELNDEILRAATKLVMEMVSNQDISIIAPIADILSPTEVEVIGDDDAQINITQTIDGMAEELVESGLLVKYYDPFDDAPKEIEMKRNWWKLLSKILIAAAIVVAVAALAAATVVTGGAALGIAASAAAVFKTVIVASVAAGCISAIAALTVSAIKGESWEDALYHSLDSFANGAIVAAFITAAIETGGVEALGLEAFKLSIMGTVFGSAQYQLTDMLLDSWYGPDYDDSKVTVGSFLGNIAWDVVGTIVSFGIMKGFCKLVDLHISDIRNATWRDYWHFAGEANGEYGANFRTQVNVLKQYKTIPKRNIGPLKTFLEGAVRARYGEGSMFYFIMDQIVSSMAGEYTGIGAGELADIDFGAVNNTIKFRFKFDDNDNLVVLPAN